MIPLTHQLSEAVQAERRQAALAARLDRLNGRPALARAAGTCSPAPSTVPQRLAFKLGFVPAAC